MLINLSKKSAITSFSQIKRVAQEVGFPFEHETLSNDELIIPETMESENPYGSARITGRNLVYKFDGEKFKFYKTEYGENLYSGLCNYLYNIIIVKKKGDCRKQSPMLPMGN